MTVSVDDDFARFGAKSYAINKITSVEVRQRNPHAMGCAVVLGLMAVLSVLLTLSGAIFMIVGALTFGGFAWWQRKRAMIVEYQLFLITTASETQAFVTRDKVEVDYLRERIEGAMARHSRGEGRG